MTALGADQRWDVLEATEFLPPRLRLGDDFPLERAAAFGTSVWRHQVPLLPSRPRIDPDAWIIPVDRDDMGAGLVERTRYRGALGQFCH